MYLIVYDVRRADDRVRLKVNRELHRAGAVMLQHSVWESGELKKLRGLAALINLLVAGPSFSRRLLFTGDTRVSPNLPMIHVCHRFLVE
ncbi:MAG: CRISPR-associated endonuclease Cas2 [Candidatus Hadarchaeales archaeon]